MFDHEKLDVYRLALETLRWMKGSKFPSGQGWIRDQGLRAMYSVVLNIAEGRSRRPDKSEKYHYRVALASAAEVCAVLDCVDLSDTEEYQEKLRRIRAMLEGLLGDRKRSN